MTCLRLSSITFHWNFDFLYQTSYFWKNLLKPRKMTKTILSCLIILLMATSVNAQRSGRKTETQIKPVVADFLKPALRSEVGGHIGSRLNASYENRILAQDVDRLIAPFLDRSETSCWQSEFWGKWYTSAVLAYHYRPEPRLKEVLDKAAAGLTATQSPDGYIGNYRDDRRLEAWDIWGRKYSMLGLIAHYDVTGNTKSLESARKVADHLMSELSANNALIVQKGNHKGMAASSVLEPICQLYTRTGDKRYLDFAEEIVRQWETPEGPQLITKSEIDVAKRWPKPDSWYGPGQGQKAYEMMSCYEGLLELYRLTGRQEYKMAVKKTWQNILDTEINIAGSGASAEAWFGGNHYQTSPVYHYQETCVTVTWIKLSQQLLRLTGDVKYADAIEQAYYNALLGSMNPDGADWAKYTPLNGERKEGSEQCGMGLNCCNASGPRGLFTLPLTTVMSAHNGIQVNFFTEGKTTVTTPGNQQAIIIQETSYPVSGEVNITLSIQKPEEMTLGIRIPAWSKISALSVNGTEQSGLVPGEIASIKRVWNSGDKIILTLDMRGRIIRQGANPASQALARGPVVLARDSRLQGPVIDAAIYLVADKEGIVNLEPVDHDSRNFWMQYKTMVGVEAYTEGGAPPAPAVFCDYSSAGYPTGANASFRVWFTQLVNPQWF